MRTRDLVNMPNPNKFGKPCKKCSQVHDPKRCSGHVNGKPCGRYHIVGGTCCYNHGGQYPHVRAKAVKRVKEMVMDLIDPKRLLREAANIATFQVSDILNDDGSIKPISEWNERALAAVGGLELVKRNMRPDDGQVDDIIKVKAWEKTKALDMLFRHHALYNDKLELLGQVDLVTRLQAGRKRVADAAKR